MVTCAADMDAGQAVAEGGALAVAAPAASTGGRAEGGREPEGLPCPRCESTDTKFCYYNNYNLSQPRHFCRACRRYWTRGGALRNVPVGGGTRKATVAGRRKQRAAGTTTPPAPSAASAALALPLPPAPALLPPLNLNHGALLRQYGLMPFPAPAMAPSPLAAVDPDRRLLDLGGSFSSLIAAAAAPAPDVAAHFSAGFLMGGLAPGRLALAPSPPPPAAALPPPPPPQHQHQLQVSQALPEGLIWSMGWPDLSI